MTLSVVTEKSAVDATRGVVVLKSDRTEHPAAIAELNSPACRNEAIKFAAQSGLPSPAVNGNVEVYPVDADGKEVDDPRTQKLAGYQASIPVAARLR